MVSFGLENINRTFFLTSKTLNMLQGALFAICFLRNTLLLAIVAASLVIGSGERLLLDLNLQKDHSYFGFRFRTTDDCFYCLY